MVSLLLLRFVFSLFPLSLLLFSPSLLLSLLPCLSLPFLLFLFSSPFLSLPLTFPPSLSFSFLYCLSLLFSLSLSLLLFSPFLFPSLLLPYPSLSFSSHSLFLSVHLLTLLYKTWNCCYYDLSFLFSFPLFPPILSFISTSSKPTL